LVSAKFSKIVIDFLLKIFNLSRSISGMFNNLLIKQVHV